MSRATRPGDSPLQHNVTVPSRAMENCDDKSDQHLPTNDFGILEIMLDGCLGREDLLVSILKRKIETATVMFRDDFPVNPATLSSLVTFSVNGREPDSRIISHDRLTSPTGMFLQITTARGLALVGLSEGQEFTLPNADGQEKRILLHEVHYQPERTKREKEALGQLNLPASGEPALRVITGAFCDKPRLVPTAYDRFDGPGPSTAGACTAAREYL